jgi:hypothetical protein
MTSWDLAFPSLEKWDDLEVSCAETRSLGGSVNARYLYSSRNLPSCQNALDPSLLIATEPKRLPATALGKAMPRNARANCRCSIFHCNTGINKGAEQAKR